MIGICALCDEKKELKQSHLLPSFVFKWTNQHGTGYLRSSENPSKRVQDGLKPHLLCADCEQNIGTWETKFSEKFFKPFHDNAANKIEYSDWLIKFAVSISWRILAYRRLGHGLDGLSEEQETLTNRAFSSWKKILRGEGKYTGDFEQHILPVDIIKTFKGESQLSPYINRYFVGTSEFDLLRTDSVCLVYAKLNKLIIVGIIQQPTDDFLEGTLIEYPDGEFGPRRIIIPESFLHHFNTRANQVAGYLASLSDKQWATIGKAYEQDIARLRNSDIYIATGVDVALSGKGAFDVLKASCDTKKKS